MEQPSESNEGDLEISQLTTKASKVKQGAEEYYIYNNSEVNGELRKQVLEELQCNGIGGHSGKAFLKNPWDIATGFITRLLKSNEVIWVVVDRLSGYIVTS